MGDIVKEVQVERMLKWYGNLMRREERYVGWRMSEMKVEGRRNYERPMRICLDKVEDDIKK